MEIFQSEQDLNEINACFIFRKSFYFFRVEKQISSNAKVHCEEQFLFLQISKNYLKIHVNKIVTVWKA